MYLEKLKNGNFTVFNKSLKPPRSYLNCKLKMSYLFDVYTQMRKKYELLFRQIFETQIYTQTQISKIFILSLATNDSL